MSLSLLFFFLFSILALIICYQDFKHRLVSLWLLILYFFTCLASVYFLDGPYALLTNIISTLVYFALIFGVLVLYCFIKEKKFSNPVNTKIGLADIMIFVATGITLDMIELVLFFSVSFLTSALMGLFWFNRRGQTVPLAGILTILYASYYFFKILITLIAN